MKGVLSFLFLFVWAQLLAQETAPDINAVQANGHTQLTAAVTLGDKNQVSDLLSKGASPDVKNTSGDLPLTIAAKNKRNDLINLLIGSKANANGTDAAGNTALFYSVQANDVQSAQALLVAGANANAKGVVEAAVTNKNQQIMLALSTYKADFTPGLAKAAQMNDAQLFRTLVNYGAKCGDVTPYARAIDNNNAEIALLALDNGVNAAAALDYTIVTDKRAFLTICVSKGADVNKAASHAAKKGESTICLELIQRYNANKDQILKDALEANMLPAAEIALQQGADPNPFVKQYVAAKDQPRTELLLKNKGDATLALRAAVENENLDFAKLAFHYGALSSDTAALGTAVRRNNTKIAELMVQQGAKATNPVLMKYPVAKSNVELARILITAGGSVLDPKLMESAANVGNTQMVELLLESGAIATDGMKAAVVKNNEPMVKLLLSKGAMGTDPELMATAASNGSVGIVNALMDVGADPNSGMKNAINFGKDQVVDALLARGANVSDPEYLAGAVSKSNLKLTNLLIEKGAPLSYNSSSNDNLLHLACRVESFNIVDALLKKGGVDINQKNSSGETPLHVAVNSAKNDVELCDLLLKNGADIKARTGNGKTVYQLAKGKKLKDFLKSKGAPKK
jgi:ankyrin repeat protein